MSCATRLASPMGVRSTQPTRSNESPQRSASSSARRVFPLPPAPVRVSSRADSSRLARSSSSRPRPTKRVRCTGTCAADSALTTSGDVILRCGSRGRKLCDGARYAPEPNVSTHRSVAPTVLEELLEDGEGLGGGEPAPHDEQGDRHTLEGGGEGAVEPRLAGETTRHQHQPLDLGRAEESQLEGGQATGIGGDDDHPVEPDSLEEVLHPSRDVLAVG